MSLQIGDNFSYKGAKPLDNRLIFGSLSEMVAAEESTLYTGIISYVTSRKTFYTFDIANDVDETTYSDDEHTIVDHEGTGKWREFIAGVSPEELLNYYTKEQTDTAIATKIAEVVDGAPDSFDTLKELADWIANDTTGAAKMASDIQQNADDIADLQTAVSSASAKTTKDITANVAVGGIKIGDVVATDTEFTAFVEKLIYKEITPTVSVAFNVPTVQEKGTTVAAGATFTLNVTNAATQTTTLNKVEFYRGSDLLGSQDFVEGTYRYMYTTVDAITANTTLTAKLIYNDDKEVAASASITFVAPSYYGVVDNLVVTSDIVAGLTKNVKTSKGFTWNAISMSNSRLCYAIPVALGALGSVKDANNFEYLSSYTRTTMDVTSAAGNVESYYVYVLTDAVTVAGFKQVYA